MTVDFQMILLNGASGIALVKAFFDENLNLDIDMSLTTIGGFLVLLSVVALNIAKAYKEIKTAKSQEKETKDND